jgi:PD-(D/E)XK nuclease superfamily
MKRRLPLLTHSSIAKFRRCPREYFYSYVKLRRGIARAPALVFGALMHVGLAAWWMANGKDRYEAAHRAMANVDGVDDIDMVKARCLMLGYTERWSREGLEGHAVNVNFRRSMQQRFGSLTEFDMGGSIDGIVKDSNGQFHVIEHKTTSQDISAGSIYWRGIVSLDPQVSTYDAVGKDAYNTRDVIYDVIRKPDIEPMKATPEESKKYTKPTKAEPIPRLYANQRENDEDLIEYQERLMANISERPHWYYARSTIVRLNQENEDHADDATSTADMISRAVYPRNPGACERYHRLCEYHPVCTGETNIKDSTRYESKSRAHEELPDDL